MTPEPQEDYLPPDPEGKAQELLAQEKPTKGKRGGARPGAGRKAGKTAEPPPVDPGPPSEAEIQSMTVLFGIVWGLLAVRVGGLTDLDEMERRSLGTAAVPVFRKYANLLGGFEAEFTFIIVAGGLVMAHLPPKQEDDAFVVDEQGQPVPPEPDEKPQRGLWNRGQ